jgi:hypothetical protein
MSMLACQHPFWWRGGGRRLAVAIAAVVVPIQLVLVCAVGDQCWFW